MKFKQLLLRPTQFDTSVAFYRDQLQFHVLAEWGKVESERGMVLGDESGHRILLTDEIEADEEYDGAIQGRPSIVYACHDLNGIYQKLKDTGTIVVPPEINRWGNKWMIIRDPDHNLLILENELN
ncbi:MAG: hypothetical protein Fur0010_13720 [Bdellovibrio sp.]